jgi:hypothetical protein
LEKAVVFGPIAIFFGCFFVLIAIFIGFIIKLILKTKRESYTGKVIEKKVNEKWDDEKHRTDYFYILVTQLSDGKIRNMGVAKGLYDQLEVGDSIGKNKGELLPHKI